MKNKKIQYKPELDIKMIISNLEIKINEKGKYFIQGLLRKNNRQKTDLKYIAFFLKEIKALTSPKGIDLIVLKSLIDNIFDKIFQEIERIQ